MCGIAGMVALGDDRPAEPATVQAMCDAQRHRGPDDAGLWSSDDGRAALGHRRLSIIDLSPSGHQPMSTADGRLHVVYNGEIYNFRELRKELEDAGERFRTESDTEVILLGYRVWGLGVLDRIVGMFAFALYDQEARELVLARDPLGIKPLYYAVEDGRLTFSSEVQPLRRAVDCGEVDPAALAEFLAWGSIGAPRTLYANARALPEGSWLRVRAGRLDGPRPYFRLADVVGRTEPMSAEEAAEFSRQALLASVRRHRVADVEVGAFLSGGVDSTALVGLMSEVSDRPITSVNLSFQSEALDEGPLAKLASDHYGTRHHRIDVRVEEIHDHMMDAVEALDQPSVDGTNVYFVSQAAVSAGLKVAVSGVGGDELFAGYATFDRLPAITRAQGWLGRIPGMAGLRGPLARTLPRVVRRGPGWRAAMTLAHGATWPGAYYAIRGVFAQAQVRALLAPEIREQALAASPEAQLAARVDTAEVPEHERASLLEIARYLQCQLLRDTDAMSMRHSLEVRTPLVDRQLFADLFRIPAVHRHARPAKLQLREAARPRVPESLWARKKQGFAFPLGDWLRSHSLPLELPEHPALDPAAMRAVESDFRSGRLHFSRFWALLLLGPYLAAPEPL